MERRNAGAEVFINSKEKIRVGLELEVHFTSLGDAIASFYRVFYLGHQETQAPG